MNFYIIRGGCNKRPAQLEASGRIGTAEHKKVLALRDAADALIQEKEKAGLAAWEGLAGEGDVLIQSYQGGLHKIE